MPLWKHLEQFWNVPDGGTRGDRGVPVPQVTVEIDGKVYRMACGDGEEEHLEGLARRFDGTVQDLKGAFGPIGDQRLTVMAGITAMDRLHEAEKRIGKLESQVARLSGDGSEDIDLRDAQVAKAVETATRRIDRIANRLRNQDAEEQIVPMKPRLRANG